MAITRADVAERAGVSPAVVSYVLNPGTRPVAPQTRARVLAAIQELNYRPNAVAQALRAGPTHSLGLLVPDLTNPFFSQLSRALEDAAFDRGLVLLIGSTQEDPEREAAYIHSFVDRRVDALLLVAPQEWQMPEEVAASGLPVVTLDRVDDSSAMSSVGVDGSTGVFDAVGRLVELGHRRIGFIGGPEGLRVADDRIEGWRRGLATVGVTPRSGDVMRSPFSRVGGSEAAKHLLEDESLTAVITSADVQAFGLLAEARRRGRSVPNSLSVISFDGTELAEFADPPLSVIQQPIAGLVEGAMSALDQVRVDGASTRMLLPTRFIPRDSVGPVLG